MSRIRFGIALAALGATTALTGMSSAEGMAPGSGDLPGRMESRKRLASGGC